MRWIARGDIDGFFGLALDNLVQLLLIDTLCRGVLGFPPELVYGRILPGAAISILVGNVAYSLQARRLAERTGRSDVCALPYGINTVSLFAHVFLIMLPAKALAERAGLPDPARVAWQAGLLATLAVTMPLFALINAGIERIAYKPLRTAPRLAALITADGVSFIVQNVSLAVYGVDFESVPNFIPRTKAFAIGDVVFQWDNLAVFMIVIPVLVVLTWFVRTTRQGKAMRAVAQDPEASAMMGIDVNRTISVTFFLAGSLAAAAGLVYLLQFNMRYDTGFELGLIAFTAAVLGGIGNLAGAVVGALVIGFIQSFNEGLTWHAPGGDWTRAIVFGILIAVLVFRPEGLLGEQTPEGA